LGILPSAPATTSVVERPLSLPTIAPAEPIATYLEPPGAGSDGDRDDEPALPEEERRRAAGAAEAPTPPMDASPGRVLHVRFSSVAGAERLVGAMETFRSVLRERPGATKVVIHLPSGVGSALPMELRSGVAYDAELLSEVRRRLGEGMVDLSLA
jgi:hypothetical protein